MTGPFLQLTNAYDPDEIIRVNFALVRDYRANRRGTVIVYDRTFAPVEPNWEHADHDLYVAETPEQIDAMLDLAGVRVVHSPYAPTVTVGPVS